MIGIKEGRSNILELVDSNKTSNIWSTQHSLIKVWPKIM